MSPSGIPKAGHRRIDPEVQAAANLRRAAWKRAQHEAARDPATGKSRLAVEAGRLGAIVRIANLRSALELRLRSALERHMAKIVAPCPDDCPICNWNVL
jgi:hypothetical protein